MKKIMSNALLPLGLALFIVGCSSDHDLFYGEYRGQSDTMLGTRTHTLELAKDFAEIDGTRVALEDISIRELGDERELVLVFEGGETDTLAIINDDTLNVNLGVTSVDLSRVVPHNFEGHFETDDGSGFTVGADYWEEEGWGRDPAFITVESGDDGDQLVVELEEEDIVLDILDDDRLAVPGDPDRVFVRAD